MSKMGIDRMKFERIFNDLPHINNTRIDAWKAIINSESGLSIYIDLFVIKPHMYFQRRTYILLALW